MLKVMEKYGRVDVLVNNAGANGLGPVSNSGLLRVMVDDWVCTDKM
jgi:NADP-dependent 3-hydroxy acid dehydrogenase YdfG